VIYLIWEVSIVLGERIKQSRINKKLKQYELANKLCVSQSTVAGWESGARKPDTDMLSQLANILDVTTDYLLGNSEDPTTENTPDISDSDIKFALFGDVSNITDAQFEEVKRYARYLKERDRGDK